MSTYTFIWSDSSTTNCSFSAGTVDNKVPTRHLLTNYLERVINELLLSLTRRCLLFLSADAYKLLSVTQANIPIGVNYNLQFPSSYLPVKTDLPRFLTEIKL